jgi:Protein of unknown function (DUF4019)
MDTSQLILKAAQVAGIGGIALGVLLLLFRDVIRKNMFPMLGQTQAYRLIKLILILTFTIAALGLGAWVYVHTKSTEDNSQIDFPAHTPEPTINSHLQLIDDEKYEEAYLSLSQEARSRIQKDLFVSTFASQRKPLGKPSSRIAYGVSTSRQIPGESKGAFIVSTFITDFSKGEKFVEVVTLTAESGIWKILFHQINPCQSPYCPSK